MGKKFVSIWFRYLTTDWFSLRRPELRKIPFVLRTPSHGRMVISASNAIARAKGISDGMVLADARAAAPSVVALDDQPELILKLLRRLGEWSIRYAPNVAIDPPDGLLLDASGCSHLWGGDANYVTDIEQKLETHGYRVRAAMAGTIGAAWAIARYSRGSGIIESGKHHEALMGLPPEALRLEPEALERLHKLGLHQLHQFISMPRATLRRRFGAQMLLRIDQATGALEERMEPIQPVEPYQERLPCLEPIVTAKGIEIALERLLETLCHRLRQEQKGLRTAVFKGYRVDGKVVQLDIGTSRPTHHVNHLFKLFEVKISTFEPALGIELFILEAPKVEELMPEQEQLWEEAGGLDDMRLSELVDKLAGKFGAKSVQRYLPDEHYWPERSFRPALSLQEKATTLWRVDKLRPLQLLSRPERIEVSAPIPDYPPMLFRYKGKVHEVARADGPERIEQEWWLQQGQHRDYYRIEDKEGHRFWIFRSGHYDDESFQWYVHGFFA
ncbi:DNA polymerase Y family protein [uncultured Imperialibacter sp.]|uniref:Y-family DNA polymerase n=1 Tax=uncultured Imperialibacter sp. TaxID=1672639 RepID=UPI0030DCA571|tara:strand:+ start:12343 stop:13842 length:1500 start_codon:yes stop_codon:yes gene_type:complete